MLGLQRIFLKDRRVAIQKIIADLRTIKQKR